MTGEWQCQGENSIDTDHPHGPEGGLLPGDRAGDDLVDAATETVGLDLHQLLVDLDVDAGLVAELLVLQQHLLIAISLQDQVRPAGVDYRVTTEIT